MPVLRTLDVGLNSVDPEKYYGWNGVLTACENDAAGLETLAVSRTKVQSKKRILTPDATIERFKSEMYDLSQILEPLDEFMGSYSGHGGQRPGGIETFCFFDGELMDYEFRQLLALFKPGVKIAFIIDSCHAGGVGKGFALRPESRYAQKQSVRESPPVPQPESLIIQASVALLCACQPNETALDGSEFGAWTGSLLRGFQEGKTWNEWFNRSYDLTPHQQHPQLDTLGKLDPGTGILDSIALWPNEADLPTVEDVQGIYSQCKPTEKTT